MSGQSPFLQSSEPKSSDIEATSSSPLSLPPTHPDPTDPTHHVSVDTTSTFNHLAPPFVPVASTATTSTYHDHNSGLDLPFYAAFFNPRLPSPETGRIVSPIPTFTTIEQALNINKSLTTFHVAVVLAYEKANGDKDVWEQELKKLVDENMPGLSHLGVQAHQIVFFYHGRWMMETGNDIWKAIARWQEEQNAPRKENAGPSGHRDDDKQEVVEGIKQENFEQKAQELRQQEPCSKRKEPAKDSRPSKEKEAKREKILKAEQAAKKWTKFAKQEESKSKSAHG